MLYACVFTVLVCGVMYLLYDRGLAAAKNIRALLFVFRPGKTSHRFTLDAYTGWVRHGVRFREGRICAFTLDARLTGGDAECLLLDRDKRPLLRLTPQSPAGAVRLEAGRYILRWTFQKASGTCALRWQTGHR